MISQYNILIGKLDKFIRRYYTNMMLRGAILSGVYVLGFFLCINLMEYYFYLSTPLRMVLFFGFLISSLVFVSRFFLLPLLHHYRLGKIISYEKAAQIIGAHFAEVKDKLLNVLQLYHNAHLRAASTGVNHARPNDLVGRESSLSDFSPSESLLFAAIDQKAVELKPVDFSFAIDLSQNRKYIKYLAPPVLLFLFILIAAPNIIKQGTERLYHSTTYYERQAPFQFLIQNKQLVALQFDNYTLELKMQGDVLPDEVSLEWNKNIYRLKKKDKNTFTYEFSNLQQPVKFQFTANGFYSKEYTLQVLPKPLVAGFEVKCEYPPYTGKKNETIRNMGDLVVPAGSKLTWKFNTQNVEGLSFVLGDTSYNVPRTGKAEFTFAKTFLQSTPYVLKVSNSNVKDADSVSYSLNVVPDLYPVISVSEQRDSALQKYFYYSGEATDDYGLSKLTFNYQLTRADSGAENVMKSVPVAIASGTEAHFTYYWQLSDFGIKPGDKISYYFEVWDNDAVHGNKSTKSNTMVFDMPTVNDLNKQISKDNKELKDEMKQTMNQAEDLKNQLHNMQDKLQEKKNLDWDDKKNLAENIDKQKDLQKQLESIKDKMDQNFEKQSDYKDVSPEIAEKEKRLQDLFDQVMDKDTKELYDKLQKMLEELQKKDALNQMQDMAANNEKVEKELDRMLALFKKLEFDQKLQETADKLDKLAQKQDELSKETKDNAGAKDKGDKGDKEGKDSKDVKDQKAQDDLKKQQDKLNEDLNQVKKDVADLDKLNKETQGQQDFKDVNQDMQSAQQESQDAQQNMSQNQNSKASKSQKSASGKMKSASKKLSDMKMQMEMDENAEDMQAIRQLLKNTLQLSFDQEKLMGEVKETNINNPKYVELMHDEGHIRENSKMVEDSLYALAKRQDQISSFVTKQINDIDKYLGKSIAEMEERGKDKAAGDEQFVMTGYNNLALLLSEALQKLQQQNADEPQGSQSMPSNKMCSKCKKPGGGLPNLSKLQKQLNDKISQMAEMMSRQGQGQKPDPGLSKQFAEMAQMQAQIRKELEKINAQENKDGKNSLGDLGNMAKQMEKTETNLVNKQLTAEMVRRQQEIMTHLLEAENAERQRDQKQERESSPGKDIDRKIPPSIEAYLKAKQSEIDLYKTVPPSLKPYYKALEEKYFRNLTIEE